MPVNVNSAHALPTAPVWQEGALDSIGYTHFYGGRSETWAPGVTVTVPFLSSHRSCPSPLWWNLVIHPVGEIAGDLAEPNAILQANLAPGDYYTHRWARIAWEDGSTWHWVVADIARGLQLTIPPARYVNVGIIGEAPFAIVGQGQPANNVNYTNTLLSGSLSAIHTPGNRVFTVSDWTMLHAGAPARAFYAPPHSWAAEAFRGAGTTQDLRWFGRAAIIAPLLTWMPGQYRTGKTLIPSAFPNLQANQAEGIDTKICVVWECKL